MKTINSIILIIFGLVGLIKRKNISVAILSQHLRIWGKERFDKKANSRNFILVQTIVVIIGGSFFLGGIFLFLKDNL